mmetsp:Transcript_54902/g.103097  ORF Transcript_54902/g.103097 Transcript_54902/m.103097 type:complete len:237 (+) Transcript_54902:70-780(+)
MRSCLFLLALACTSHARRVQAPGERMKALALLLQEFNPVAAVTASGAGVHSHASSHLGASPPQVADRRNACGVLMALKEGDSVPMDTDFMIIDDKPTKVPAKDVFAGKKVVVFGVPGAMTPTCSEKHLPGYLNKAEEFKAKGVDKIVCISVNDPFVVKAWAKAAEVGDKIDMLADGGGAFTKAAGLDFDTGDFGGVRCTRMSMLVNDGKVEKINLEEGGGFTEGGGSSAEFLLSQM